MNIDINSLDFNNMGSWPPAAKAVVIGLLAVVVIGLGVWFDTMKQIDDLNQLSGEEQKLRRDFETKQAKAVNLEAYKRQLDEMKRSFGSMLRQLPSKTEVADLLVDISQTGLASGLEFRLFKPAAERPVEFYAELPIDITVVGTYHEFGEFVSGIASLPRIVTIHNYDIRPAAKGNQSSDLLIMNATAKTYRYLDEKEQEAIRAQRQAQAKKKR